MSFTTFTVGRSDDADVRIDDETVSRFHLEMTVTGDRKVYIIDAASSGGTQVWRHESWEKFGQGFVSAVDTLRLGNKEVRVRDLLGLIPSPEAAPANTMEPVTFRPKRSAQTGEVFLDQ